MPYTLRSIGLKRLRDEIRRHGGAWRTAAEPLPDIALERDAVHVVVERGRERPAEGVVIDTAWIGETDVVVREATLGLRQQAHTIGGWITPDW